MAKIRWTSLNARGRLGEVGVGGSVSLRVRKLARELGKEPAYVLGVLHHLGFSRFRSIQDMLPDRLVGQVRAAVAGGLEIRTAPVDPAPTGFVESASAADSSTADLMASLVPGVVPLSKGVTPTARPSVEAEVDVVIPVDPVASEPESESRLVGRWDELLERERAVQRAEEGLAFSVAAHETTVREAREQPVVSPLQSSPVDVAKSVDLGSQRLIDLLALRGIAEESEQISALEALARHPTLRKHLLQVQVSTSSKLVDLLTSHVVLTDGTPPDGLHGYAGVSVAKIRAEWPGEEQLGPLLSQLGSGLLLRGFRRIVFVELGEKETGLLRTRIDSRIDWTTTSADSVSTSDVALDVVGVPDAVIVWGACEVGDLASRCAERGIWYTHVESEGVLARVETLCMALDGD